MKRPAGTLLLACWAMALLLVAGAVSGADGPSAAAVSPAAVSLVPLLGAAAPAEAAAAADAPLSSDETPGADVAALPRTCPLCLTFAQRALAALVQAAEKAGVMKSCDMLCGTLPPGLEEAACEALCDYVGIKVFADLIKRVDLDPFYLCTALHVCRVRPDAAVETEPLQIAPPEAPAGATFAVRLPGRVLNATGAGEILLVIIPPGRKPTPLKTSDATAGLPVGEFTVEWKLDTSEDTDYFTPGEYLVDAVICAGECGSSHPNSKTLARSTGSFKITASEASAAIDHDHDDDRDHHSSADIDGDRDSHARAERKERAGAGLAGRMWARLRGAWTAGDDVDGDDDQNGETEA